ncbi:DUF397 domain-containing protein [Actinomadura madurae]|uniref:DUF397 domain-containing protein n=1 Tax=Actinomadura madurae TaxID=1993 RepID=UPI0020D24353|nr:DUF397 domain-containing protein [Actinomadura madurae]MCP9949361.1 DUF397 domain-containing protein [Actinomadura madurae]MCP9966117.1 DUF397 domain-containing protein [Actinomadura madurae]MCP9978604.1 DUF397 domain-containing protein [Actinomadura madurae]MCQ0009871.1 DUF397 domain-containing protein [Actinomadura madurae]MCQ0014802.1 DUF397 domain-containing protein [Actinomadura madurae]
MNTPTSHHTHWRKSCYSGANEGNCIEIADLNEHVGIRDSKAPETGHLTLTRKSVTDLLNRLAQHS